MALHTGSTGSAIRANTFEPEVYRQGRYLAMLGREGIHGSGDYAVTQKSTPNMSVDVAAGFAVINGTTTALVQGAYDVYNDATTNVAVTASNATNPRIDLVCLTIRDAYYAGANNDAVLQVIAGTPAASPAVPATPASSLVLAHLYIAANSTTVVTGNINSTTGTNNPDTVAWAPRRCTAWQGSATQTGTVGQTVTVGTATDVTGTSFTFNAQATRRYQLLGQATVQAKVAMSFIGLSILLDGAIQAFSYTGAAGVDYFACLHVDFTATTLAAGMHTAKMQIIFVTANANNQVSAGSDGRNPTLALQDIGPA